MDAPIRPPHRYRIVIALDRSEYAEIVLERAIDQAARHADPDLHFVTVISPDDDAEQARTWLVTQSMQGLELFGEHPPNWRSRAHVIAGKAADEIANLAADLRAHLIVIGRFGVHERHGSTADLVLQQAPCPTLVVPFTGEGIEAQRQCTACVEIREVTDGKSWFCSDHARPGRMRLTEILPSSTSSSHGGPLW